MTSNSTQHPTDVVLTDVVLAATSAPVDTSHPELSEQPLAPPGNDPVVQSTAEPPVTPTAPIVEEIKPVSFLQLFRFDFYFEAERSDSF